ncbi:sorbitol dehydrogenase-like [Physella acuta]|uniref:sorbitol dehydrogenase-like n=1 Tax=Physella acuta TaxID=109671 RepID=UPI0027DBEDBD|nr:sorbitol dehydrogenase-like [Physella acuta]
MEEKNLTLTLYGVKDLRLVEKPVREPQYGEVQISVRSVGICGSDVTYWQTGRIGSVVVTDPLDMGHEPSGVVSKVGAGVTDLRVGDRVAIEPLISCQSCRYCRLGKYNVCSNLKYLASPPTDGCLTRFFCHPAHSVHRLPDNVSFDEGALVQPLALGFHACERGEITVGHYVLVSGAGPLGMSVVLAAKAFGAAKICVTDIDQSRLDFIKNIGAGVTVTVGAETPEVTSQNVKQSLGRDADVAIECSGDQRGVANVIYSTKHTGKVVIAGFGDVTTSVPLVEATLKQLDLRGMIRFANNYPTVIEAIASGRVNVLQLVTHRFPLERALDAYNMALRREGVKIIIDCHKPVTSL